MRIITGTARGTLLLAPEGLHTRPTHERAKQGIYNILQFEISGKRVLDLFAGSGQMGLEALSRGAAHAVFCDNDADALAAIRSNIRKTHMEAKATVLDGDFKLLLRTLPSASPFDLIFLDPPYRADLLDAAITLLTKYHLVAQDAYLICESDAPLSPLNPHMSLHKYAAYGKNHISIFKWKESSI